MRGWCRRCGAGFVTFDDLDDHTDGCVMPAKAARRCGQPGCPNSRPCPEHAPAPWAGSNRQDRLPANWPKLRRYVLERDRHRCYRCGARATEVDHRIAGDNHHPSNLAAICVPCHRKKSAAEGVAARLGVRKATR